MTITEHNQWLRKALSELVRTSKNYVYDSEVYLSRDFYLDKSLSEAHSELVVITIPNAERVLKRVSGV